MNHYHVEAISAAKPFDSAADLPEGYGRLQKGMAWAQGPCVRGADAGGPGTSGGPELRFWAAGGLGGCVRAEG